MRARLRQKEISFTNKLIILNIILFVILQILFIVNAESLDYIALKPSNIFQGKMIWTLFTSMFMHANLAHLFVNMVSLFFVGNFVERLIGKKRLAIFYLLSGIIAGLFFVLLSLIFKAEFDVYAVGASGAIFALAALLMILIPRLPVLVFFILPMPLWAAMGVLLFGLWIVSIFAGLPIGNTAHFGGFVCGVLFGVYLRMKYKRKVKLLNTYILGRR
jgi:membrane associated rhomboid family serine protease